MSHIIVITDFIWNAANKGIFVQLEVMRTSSKKSFIHISQHTHARYIRNTEVQNVTLEISYLQIHVFARNVMKHQVHGT
jgi:hypothetical protein